MLLNKIAWTFRQQFYLCQQHTVDYYKIMLKENICAFNDNHCNNYFSPVGQIKCIVVPHKVKQQSCPRQRLTISTGVPQPWWWIWDTATVWTTTTSSWHLHSLQVLYPQHHIDWYYKQWIPRNWTCWLNRTTSMLAIYSTNSNQPTQSIHENYSLIFCMPLRQVYIPLSEWNSIFNMLVYMY